MHDPLILAYLAGVIDSDGCIGIHKNTHNVRNRKGGSHHAVYIPRVSIGQVQTEAVELAAEIFGGNVNPSKPAGNRRTINIWKLDGGKTVAALLALIPYLRIKRDRAENVLRLIDLQHLTRWPKVEVRSGEPLITTTEFARRVGIAPCTVNCATRKGTIPCLKIGRFNMVPESFVAEYLHRKSVGFTRRRLPEIDAQMEACFLKAKELNRTGHVPARHGPPPRPLISTAR